MMNADLLEKKYPIGTRVKLIEARVSDPSLLDVKPGNLGTVCGVDRCFSALEVKWDNGSNYDLIPGYDRFSTVYGKYAKEEKS